MGNQKSPISGDGRLCGQWSAPCIIRNSHGLRSPERAISLVVPQVQPALLLVVGPVRVASDFKPETPGVVVSIFQLAPDQYLKPGALAPFDGVCVVANDAFELASIVFVVEANLRFADHWKSEISKTTEARRFRMFRD